MGMLLAVGANMNLLAGAALTPSPAADGLFPVAELVNGYPGHIFKFGSVAADSKVTADLTAKAVDVLGGIGGFNAWTGGGTIATGWTMDSPAPSQEIGTVHSGSSAAKF